VPQRGDLSGDAAVADAEHIIGAKDNNLPSAQVVT
jgi:hypothetical protein